MGYSHPEQEQWAFAKNIATTDGTTTLQPAPTSLPGYTRRLVIQRLQVFVTTAAAQAYDLEDQSGTVELFKAPASLSGDRKFDYGPLGVALTVGDDFRYVPAAAGVGMTVNGFGYIRDTRSA